MAKDPRLTDEVMIERLRRWRQMDHVMFEMVKDMILIDNEIRLRWYGANGIAGVDLKKGTISGEDAYKGRVDRLQRSNARAHKGATKKVPKG